MAAELSFPSEAKVAVAAVGAAQPGASAQQALSSPPAAAVEAYGRPAGPAEVAASDAEVQPPEEEAAALAAGAEPRQGAAVAPDAEAVPLPGAVEAAVRDAGAVLRPGAAVVPDAQVPPPAAVRA